MTVAAQPTIPLVIRPRRVRQIAIPVAAGLMVVFGFIAVLLRTGSTGVRFGAADQVSLAAIGLVLAGAALLAVRPRVMADAEGVQVRNLLFGQKVPWAQIRAVRFPEGSPWARLELPADEYVPVVAIQAIDGVRAVVAIRELRAVHRAFTSVPRDPDDAGPVEDTAS